MQNNIFVKNTEPKNQIIFILFYQPIDPIFLLSFPCTEKINLVWPNVLFLELILCAVLVF